MVDLSDEEEKVTRIALDTLITALDGLPLKDEDDLFGDVAEALGESRNMLEGEVIQVVLRIKEKVGGV